MKKIYAGLGVCIFVFIAFVAAIAASRRELPVGLRDMYGDTSGIRRLIIEGTVTSWEGRYGYMFHIGPDRESTRMYVFNNSRAFSDFYRPHWPVFPPVWHGFTFETGLVPLGPYEVVAAESERTHFMDFGGNWVPAPEYRIYGEVFAVETRVHGRRLYVPELSAVGHRLFMDTGPKGYIFSSFYDPAAWEFSPGFNIPGTWYFTSGRSLSRAWGLYLPNQLAIDEFIVFAPQGPGLFGHTAVYYVYAPDGNIPMIQDSPYDEPKVAAEILLPIYLERSEDEIIGLIRLTDSFLLLVVRAGGFELTRINPFTGEIQTVFVDSTAAFYSYALQGDSLVLSGFGWGGTQYGAIAAFDLSDGGIKPTGHFSVSLWGEPEYSHGVPVHVRDMLFSDGVVYIAHTVEKNPWNFTWANTETFVSAFDSQGRLIGRSQVLNGVEDDAFWSWTASGGSQSYRRRVQSVSISRGSD